MDPGIPNIDYQVFNMQYDGFNEQYWDAEDLIPLDKPEARRNPAYITGLVDASFSQNKVTRKSHTGFVIFASKVLIHFYSKHQQMVETSASGTEFIDLKTYVKTIHG